MRHRLRTRSRATEKAIEGSIGADFGARQSQSWATARRQRWELGREASTRGEVALNFSRSGGPKARGYQGVEVFEVLRGALRADYYLCPDCRGGGSLLGSLGSAPGGSYVAAGL